LQCNFIRGFRVIDNKAIEPIMLKNQKWEEAKLFIKTSAQNFFLKGL
jgi:hypothetical protein